ncbi:alpha/beta hydrolase [Archangium violaceum]|uniref:alpha/beta fold hydrolase n=1 Tax=Archangium violaceum TaxID=83451 RepID=UPI002B283AAF|nr:alpha/beta hydrolase [Archangium violaceum]
MDTTTRPLKTLDAPGFAHHFAEVNGIRVHYVSAGHGEPILLLHGWPFTWFTWARVIPALAANRLVIAPDLRGIGHSSRPETGYDLHTLADDAAGLLAHLGIRRADVVAHDLGTEIAFMLALRHPSRVRRLVLSEAILSGLPGAEAFLAQGKPWWFAFHDVPGLAERVLVGNEGAYLDWFFTHHTYGQRGISPEARNEYVAAYTGVEALRGGFAHYRVFKGNASLLQAASRGGLKVPTLALGGNVVGDALYRQLVPIADNVVGHLIPECGHAIPEERPDALLRHLADFLS